MRRHPAAVLGAVGAAAYVGALLVVNPFHGPVLCPVRRLTGWNCPGCGSTRASWLLLHGHLTEAMRHNVLVLPALVLLTARWFHLAAPRHTAALPAWIRVPTTIPAPALRALAAGLVAFAVVRNVAGAEAWLAPPS